MAHNGIVFLEAMGVVGVLILIGWGLDCFVHRFGRKNKDERY